MSCQVTIDDALLLQAREATGLGSDRELLELGLRTLIRSRHKRELDWKGQNPLTRLLESDFIGCADSDAADLSQDYKAELATILAEKHDHR